MPTQRRIGILFLALGVVIIFAAISTMLDTGLTGLSLWLLGIGIAVAIFGALIVPSSGAGPALQQFIIVLQQTDLPWIGGRRKTDPPVPPPSPPEP